MPKKKRSTQSKLLQYQIRRAKKERTCDDQVKKALETRMMSALLQNEEILTPRCPNCLAVIGESGICYLCLEDERMVA